MDFSFYVVLSLILPIIIILGIIIVKMIVGKALPDSRYTPVDQITGGTPIVFQEQKKEKEVEDDQGDDKEKNLKRKNK